MRIPLFTSEIAGIAQVSDALELIKSGNEKEKPCVDIENRLRAMTGAAEAAVMNSITSALRNLLYSWSVCRGEAVFVPSFTSPTVIQTVLECGAVPVFVDCSRDTWHMSPEKLENAVKKCIKQNELYPRAVIVSDIFGLPFDAAATASVCAKYGLLLIEDASCALGAELGKSAAGTLGDAAVVGLGAMPGGEACAAVLTNDVQLSKSISLSACGGIKTTDNGTRTVEAVRSGSRASVDDITAQVLLSGLEHHEEKLQRRRANTERLRKAAEGTELRLQKVPDSAYGACPVFAVLAKDKESAGRMVKAFREEGIDCRSTFARPLCRNQAFKELGCQISDVPVGSELSVCTFMIPCHEELTEEHLDFICEKIKMICV